MLRKLLFFALLLLIVPLLLVLDWGSKSVSSTNAAKANIVASEAFTSEALARIALMAPPVRWKPMILRRQVNPQVLRHTTPDTLPYLPYDADMLQAMYEQANYLKRPDVKEYPVKGISKAEMARVIELLQACQVLQPEALVDRFDFYAVKTDLKDDRVRITGYYTPIIPASRVRTSEYSVPILRRPDGPVPSPAAIEAGALEGKGLELAWVRSKKELADAQMQGSCWVEYPDGKREHFGFHSSVKGRGGRYVFFKRMSNSDVIGAGFFPLTAGYSVAVDPNYIPLGATLLAELPDVDEKGQLKGYTYRLLFAQDRGGAILTTKRLDLYGGIGKKGLQEARKINGYGRLWLLLPKQ
ncbi:MAG: MltA domain-containing protein [Saprospiraceae bacterium]|nr:MltA domain-containing protein [Saprospiraceae bacterium]MDW8485149.1 MltA domain-containing protein [Saprospiraceae bacterium]